MPVGTHGNFINNGGSVHHGARGAPYRMHTERRKAPQHRFPHTDFSAPVPLDRPNGAGPKARGRKNQKGSCLRMPAGNSLKSTNPVISALTKLASSS
ncbi:hypothetical protein JCM17961_19270 [Endothiovibrio diazotrophicus]